MYVTKRYHRHGSQKFVSVGDPYNKKQKPDSRTRGRQFQTRATPSHRFSDYFTRVTHPKGERYVDKTSYLEQQPRNRRKLGFGSSDANKKGEFTSTCRTAQWKERLDRERRLERRKADAKEAKQSSKSRHNKRGTTKGAAAPPKSKRATDKKKSREFFQCRVPRLLYDIGRTKSGVTPTCNRCHRDTFFCRHRARTSARYEHGAKESDSIGPQPNDISPRREASEGDAAASPVGGATELRKPQFGRRSAVSDFYAHSHLHCG